MRSYLMLALLVAGLQVVMVAQDLSRQVQNPSAQGNDGAGAAAGAKAPAAALSSIAGMQTESDAADSENDLPLIPALLGGKGTSPALYSELERSNYLRGGVNVGATYDDNPLLASTGEVGNASVSVFPNISIEQSSSRTRWQFGYAGGLTVNQRFTNQDQGSHSLNFDSEYRLSPHVNLRVAESFSLTTGFFDAGNGIEAATGAGAPNVSLIAPLSTQRSSVTTVETNYHFAANDLVGGSGSFYDLHFSNVPTGTLLTDSETASGSAFWLHRIFRGDWAGLSYRYDRLTFDAGGGESDVHSFLAVNTLNLSQRFTLSGFLGPQYSDNQGVAPSETQSTQSKDWSIAGGAEAGWQNQRTSALAGYSRSISDGAGLLGAVRLQSVHGSFRRELVPGWAAAVTATHGTNHELIGPPGSASSINTTMAGVSLERNVGKSVGLRMGYSHEFQQQFVVPGSADAINASGNRYFVTLSYQWAKPLGM